MNATMEGLKARLPAGGLLGGKEWRFSPEPLSLKPEELKIIQNLGIYLAKFQKAANLLYRQSVNGTAPEWVARWCDRGKPEALLALAREGEQADALPSLIRPDLILTDDGPVLTEIDSVPGGTGLTAWLQEQYGSGNAHLLLGDTGMKKQLQQRFENYDVVISEEAADYRPELEWLYGSEAVHPAETYAFSGKPVYRFFEAFDWPQLSGLHDSWEPAQIVDAPLKPYLEEKLWLALFWLKPLERFWCQELGGKYFRELRKIIPYTWILEPATLPPHAVFPELNIHSWEELKNFSQKDRDLVLKISGFSPLGWGSRGVHVGADMSGEDWSQAVDRALAGAAEHPYILQPFRKGRLIRHPYFDSETGETRLLEGRVRLCPYYLRAEKQVTCLGAQATICPSDKKLIHGMSDAIIVPVSARPD